MGFRFRKSVKLAPGVRLNVSKSGVSASVGRRGASVSVGKRGVRGNVGLPGTGISYSARLDGGGGGRRGRTGETREAARVQREVERQRQWAHRLDELAKGSVSIADDGNVEILDCHGEPVTGRDLSFVWDTIGDSIRAQLEDAAKRYNDEDVALTAVHTDTPDPRIAVPYEPQPFTEPQPPRPTAKPFSSPAPKFSRPRKPGLFGLVVWPWQRAAWEAAVEKAQRDFEIKRRHWEKARAAHEVNGQRSLEEWEDKNRKWVARASAHDAAERAKAATFGDDIKCDAALMEEMLAARLQELQWPRETLVDFEVVRDGELVLLDVDLPEIEDVPEQTASVSANGKRLLLKNKSQTALRGDYAAHVHGIGLRLAGLVFQTLPRCSNIVMSGYSQRLDKGTGTVNDEYLWSARVDRATFSQIDFGNLAQVDPIAAMEKFTLRRNMTKTHIFKPITPYAVEEATIA